MECTTKSASNDSHFRFLSSLARSLADELLMMIMIMMMAIHEANVPTRVP